MSSLWRLPENPGALQKNLQLVSSWGDFSIHSFIHHQSLHSFVHSYSLASTYSLSLCSYCSFVSVPLSPLQRFFPPVSQQVAHISSPVLFSLIGQPIDRLTAGASTQLRQFHAVCHSISCRIFRASMKSLSIVWIFMFGLFCFVSLFNYIWSGQNKKAKNKTRKAFI